MKIRGLSLALMVIACLFLAPAGVAAVDYTADYSGNEAVLISERYDTTSDLNTVWADVSTVADINGDGTTTTSTDVRFIVQGINESSSQNASTLVNETRTINQDSIEQFDYEIPDGYNEDYNSYYLHVEAETDSSHILSTDNGTLYTSSGAAGGTGFLSGSGGSSGVMMGAAAVAFLLIGRSQGYV